MMTDVAMGMTVVDRLLDGHAVDIVVMTQIRDGHVTHHQSETCLQGVPAVGQENELGRQGRGQIPGRYLGHCQSHGQSLHQVEVNNILLIWYRSL